MRALGAGLCWLLLASAPVDIVLAQRPAIPPDSLAGESQLALRTTTWPAAARRLHLEALRRFHDWINNLVEGDQTGRTREDLFPDATLAQVRSLPSDAVGRAAGSGSRRLPRPGSSRTAASRRSVS